jgi:hypothetical protein
MMLLILLLQRMLLDRVAMYLGSTLIPVLPSYLGRRLNMNDPCKVLLHSRYTSIGGVKPPAVANALRN